MRSVSKYRSQKVARFSAQRVQTVQKGRHDLALHPLVVRARQRQQPAATAQNGAGQ